MLKVFGNMLFRRSDIENVAWSLINAQKLELSEEW